MILSLFVRPSHFFSPIIRNSDHSDTNKAELTRTTTNDARGKRLNQPRSRTKHPKRTTAAANAHEIIEPDVRLIMLANDRLMSELARTISSSSPPYDGPQQVGSVGGDQLDDSFNERWLSESSGGSGGANKRRRRRGQQQARSRRHSGAGARKGTQLEDYDLSLLDELVDETITLAASDAIATSRQWQRPRRPTEAKAKAQEIEEEDASANGDYGWLASSEQAENISNRSFNRSKILADIRRWPKLKRATDVEADNKEQEEDEGVEED